MTALQAIKQILLYACMDWNQFLLSQQQHNSEEKKISFEALRATLKQRTKASALQKNPSRDISEA
jgi:hypothetical protein